MPRYYFNVFHEHSERGSVGEELADRHAAWKEATVAAGQLTCQLSQVPNFFVDLVTPRGVASIG
jgi:hypothetical protein